MKETEREQKQREANKKENERMREREGEREREREREQKDQLSRMFRNPTLLTIALTPTHTHKKMYIPNFTGFGAHMSHGFICIAAPSVPP